MSGYGSRSVSPNKSITSKYSFSDSSVFASSRRLFAWLLLLRFLQHRLQTSTGYEPNDHVFCARCFDEVHVDKFNGDNYATWNRYMRGVFLPQSSAYYAICKEPRLMVFGFSLAIKSTFAAILM